MLGNEQGLGNIEIKKRHPTFEASSSCRGKIRKLVTATQQDAMGPREANSSQRIRMVGS